MEQIADLLQQSLFAKQSDRFLPQPLDVERCLRGGMPQARNPLRCTRTILTAQGDITLAAPYRRAAHGTALRKHKRFSRRFSRQFSRQFSRLAARRDTFFQQHSLDLGNHAARPHNLYPVADTDVLASQLLLVMQRGARNAHSPHHHRLKMGYGRERAAASHLNLDRKNARLHLALGKLVRNSPQRMMTPFP